MFDPTTTITFLAASIAIILAPGPAQALVLARTLADGRKAGVLTAIGLNVGTLVHAVAAALGLSAVLATSATAFTFVKIIGAVYLVYLGIQALRTKDHSGDPAIAAPTGPWQMFGRAVMTGVLNPKVAIFFLAFLPQFVDPGRGPVFLQFLILGSTLALIDVLYEIALVLVAGAVRQRLTQSVRFMRWRQRITGVVLIGLGLRLGFTERH